jgi:hypothetical protein
MADLSYATEKATRGVRVASSSGFSEVALGFYPYTMQVKQVSVWHLRPSVTQPEVAGTGVPAETASRFTTVSRPRESFEDFFFIVVPFRVPSNASMRRGRRAENGRAWL